MTQDFAWVSAVHMEPPSEQVSQLDLVVRYGQKEANLHIRPERPLDGRQSIRETAAKELHDLGTALLRMADQPSKIYGHNPNRA